MDHQAIKEEQRQMYSSGDYSWLSRLFEPFAQALVEACDVGPGTSLLDAAAGDGNVAVMAARRGAEVVACDLAPLQVDNGRKRAEREGLTIDWHECDIEEMSFADDSFDVTASTFGMVYAPRPDVVARELFRVTRPGGLVAYTAWPRDSFSGALIEAAEKYFPPDDDPPPDPDVWAEEDVARERFGPHASEIEVRRVAFEGHFDSVEQFWTESAARVPVQQYLKDYLGPERFEEWGREYREVAERFNTATDGTASITNECTLCVARKR